jgi:hypothetical protein
VSQLRPIDLGTRELRAPGVKIVIEPEDPPKASELIEVVRGKGEEDTFRIGRVLSMGTEAARELPDVQPGDRVLYPQTVAATNAAERGGKPRHIVHWDKVLAAVVEG